MSYGEKQFILDEEDVDEDPFARERATMKLAPGEVPSLTYVEPGLQITTIEVPAMGEVVVWQNFIHQLMIASGIVVLRGLGQGVWDKDYYFAMQDIVNEVVEVRDSRRMFIINIAKGDVRSTMCVLAGMADVSLATPDATFGFPEVRLGGLPAIASTALNKRVSSDNLSRLLTFGESIDAREAQRIGLVDFVGDVETELARLIYRSCQPKVTKVMYKPDCERVWGALEQQGAE